MGGRRRQKNEKKQVTIERNQMKFPIAYLAKDLLTQDGHDHP